MYQFSLAKHIDMAKNENVVIAKNKIWPKTKRKRKKEKKEKEKEKKKENILAQQHCTICAQHKIHG
jgi:hypothetical protein